MSVITLTLQLTPLAHDQYRLRLTQEDSDSGAVVNPLGDHLVTVTLPTTTPANLALDPVAIGQWLGQQLLADAAAVGAVSSTLAAAEAQNRPLRLILDLPHQLQKLEWETLSLDNGSPIALRERLRLSRLLPTVGQRPVPHTVPDPLRVLTAVAAPADLANYELPRPDADQLHDLIEATLPQATHRRCGGSLADLREALTKGADIFCLVTHGTLHQGQPYLLLADAVDQVTLVEGRELADLITDLNEQPRLVLLISCFGVAASTDSGDAAGALGPLLVEAGIPALLAMRQEFTEESARALLPVLLREVAMDGAIDRALAAARWQIRNRHDAWRPVLFARMKDGLLWDGEPPLSANTLSPYRDLRAFQENDKDFFFGRQAVVATLLERIQAQPLLAVIGPSGSGKSSSVLAGLLPAVRKTTDWLIATMRPGNDPMGALAATFLGLTAPNVPLEARLQQGRALADQLLKEEITVAVLVGELLRERPDSQLLLVVDQFEELFSQSQAAEVFVQRLLSPLDRRLPLKVVLTMRADFMGTALAIPGLATALDKRIYPLGPMSREELAQAITRPAQKVGARFEPGLVSYILDDVGEKAGNLPLLQFTLSRLWERREGRTLTFAQYEALGRVDGALHGHADSVLASIENAEEKAAVRRLVVQLIQPGLGASDTRRVAPKGQFTPTEQALIDELAGQRLLVTDQNDRGEETVEIAHEALIESWGTLRQWMNADREFRAWQERLRLELKDWQEQPVDAREAYLLPPGRLATAEEWLTGRKADIRPDETEFIRASRAHQDRLEAAEEAQRQMQLQLEQQARAAEASARQEAEERAAEALRREAAEADLRAEASARAEEQTTAAARLRRRLYFAVGAVILALIAAGAALRAFNDATASEETAVTAAAQARQAANERATEVVIRTTAEAAAEFNLATANSALDTAATSEAAAIAEAAAKETQAAIAAGNAATAQANAQTALSRQLAIQSQQLLDDWQYEIGLLLAIQAGKESDTSEAFAVIRSAINLPGRSRYILHHDSRVTQTSWNSDESLIISAGDDNTVRVWDAATGQELLTLQHDTWVLEAGWNRDESLILSRTGISVRVWDVATGQERFALQHDDEIFQASWNSEESHILTAGRDGTARTWDAITGQELFTLQHEDPVWQAIWNSDGSLILTASGDNTARVWDAATGQERFPLRHDSSVLEAGWNRDESLILTTSLDGTARVWDATTGQERFTLQHEGPVRQASWNADESLILTASEDNTARVWDAETGQERFTLQHDQPVWQAIWNSDGSLILTASDDADFIADGTARVWDAATGQENFALQHNGLDWHASWNADESLILTASQGNTAQVWDAETGQERFTLQHDGAVTQAGWNRDGSRILTAGGDNTARVWDVTLGQERFAFQHDDWVRQASWNRDGSRFLTRRGVVVQVWDAATGQERFSIEHHGEVNQVSWNADESLILTASQDNTARVWDAETGQERFALQHDGAVTQASWNSDGSQILTVSWDNTVRVWDAETGQVLVILRHDDWPRQAEWNRDESLILTTGSDVTARVWDATSGQVHVTLRHNTPILVAVWNADESLILTVSDEDNLAVNKDNNARVWDGVTGEERFAFQHVGLGWEANWNRDGSLILTVGTDNTARVWDAATGQERFAFQHEGGVNQASWNSDGSLILTAGNFNTVRVWDATTGLERLTLQHDSIVTQASWNSDESLILTQSDDTVRVWDAASGHERFALQHDSVVTQASWNRDENLILTVSDDAKVTVFYTDMVDLVAAACAIAPRNMTPAEWQRYMGDRPYVETCDLAGDTQASQRPKQPDMPLGLFVFALALPGSLIIGVATHSPKRHLESVTEFLLGDSRKKRRHI